MGPLNPNRASKSIVIVPQPAPVTQYHHVSYNTATTNNPLSTPVSDETMSGWLSKRSKNLQKSWKRNWFVLRDNSDDGRAQLVYYKDEREYKPKNIINVSDILAVVAMEPTHFAVFTDRKDYHLRADTVAECSQWVYRLKRVIDRNNISIAPPSAAVAIPAPGGAVVASPKVVDSEPKQELPGRSGISHSVPTSTTAAISIIGSAGSSIPSNRIGSPGGSCLHGQSLPSGSIGSVFGPNRVVSPFGGDTNSGVVSPGSYPGSDYFLSPPEGDGDLTNYTLSKPNALTDKSGGTTKQKRKKRLSMLSTSRQSISSISSGEAPTACSMLSSPPSPADTSTDATIARALEMGFAYGFNKKHYKHWKSQFLVLTHAGLYVYKLKHASTSLSLNDISNDATTAAAIADARLLHAIPVERLVDASEAPLTALSKTRPYVFDVIAAAATTSISDRDLRLRFAVPTEDDLVHWLAAIKLAIDQTGL